MDLDGIPSIPSTQIDKHPKNNIKKQHGLPVWWFYFGELREIKSGIFNLTISFL